MSLTLTAWESWKLVNETHGEGVRPLICRESLPFAVATLRPVCRKSMPLLGLARVNARDEPNLGPVPVDGQAINISIGLLEHSSAAALARGTGGYTASRSR